MKLTFNLPWKNFIQEEDRQNDEADNVPNEILCEWRKVYDVFWSFHPFMKSSSMPTRFAVVTLNDSEVKSMQNPTAKGWPVFVQIPLDPTSSRTSPQSGHSTDGEDDVVNVRADHSPDAHVAEGQDRIIMGSFHF